MKLKSLSIYILGITLLAGCEVIPYRADSPQEDIQTHSQISQKNITPPADTVTYQFEVPIDNVNGILKDKSTGLEWRRCALGRTWDKTTLKCKGEPKTAIWTDMVKLISKEKYAGHTDWRLPTVAEYRTLIKADRYNNCKQQRNAIQEFFPNVFSKNLFGSNHWLADNSSDFTHPMSADLELTQGMGGCPVTEDALRAHSLQPAVMVRGTPISSEWKTALSTLKNAKSINQKSISEHNAYWSGVNKKVDNFLSNLSKSSSSDINSSSSSGSNSKNFSCEYYCAEGNLLYGYSATPSTTTSVVAKNKSEAESILYKILKEKNACRGVKGDNGLSLSEKVKCTD